MGQGEFRSAEVENAGSRKKSYRTIAYRHREPACVRGVGVGFLKNHRGKRAIASGICSNNSPW